jgi:hypothetical protein
MKVVWEKNLGRPNVTAVLEACTPAEAVVSLLQGTGFNYALSMDRSGTRVEMLMIVGVAVPERPSRPGFVPPRRAEPPPALAGPEAEEPPGEDVTSEPEQQDVDDSQAGQPGTPAVPAPTGIPAPVPPPMPGAPAPKDGPPQ